MAVSRVQQIKSKRLTAVEGLMNICELSALVRDHVLSWDMVRKTRSTTCGERHTRSSKELKAPAGMNGSVN